MCNKKVLNANWMMVPNTKLGFDLNELPTVFSRLILLKRAMVEGYGTGDEESHRAVLTDMLADIRHMCDLLDLDFVKLDKTAYSVYINEKGGD
jgi:hypothetical protein